MGALTPGPEDAKEEENGADDLADPTHSLTVLLRTGSHGLHQDAARKLSRPTSNEAYRLAGANS
jgi:hypothetical protein